MNIPINNFGPVYGAFLCAEAPHQKARISAAVEELSFKDLEYYTIFQQDVAICHQL